jgi:tRNA-dihydrouridine synthase C
MSRLILAPMEGLADDVLREVLTSAGGYDWCVTEFVRVTDTVLPHSAYTRLSPELKNAARTRSGTPVRVQLLGSSPTMLAANAAHLAALNPYGIDLNFGCPTPLVNRNRGGAALLDEPELLHSIAAAVRRAVPANIPVTAKMRLGIDDTSRTLDCARALEAGGVQELTVHARTKLDGYRPPARWEWIAEIRQVVSVPLIANGEVWNVEDYRAICDVTGCSDVMLGRGAVADPMLANRIKTGCRPASADFSQDWNAIKPLLASFWEKVQTKVLPHQSPGRLKQWLGMMCRNYPQAETLYAEIRELRRAPEISAVMLPRLAS